MKCGRALLLVLGAVGCNPTALPILPSVDGSTTDRPEAGAADAGPDAPPTVDTSVDAAPLVDAGLDAPSVDLGTVVDVPALDRPDVPATICTPDASICASATERSVCSADGLATTVIPCPTPAHATAARCTGAGLCSFVCAVGFGDCNGAAADGCETYLGDDPMNCGACGTRCPSGPCGSSLGTAGTAAPGGWGFNGSASWDSTTGSIVLTRALVDQRGTAYYGRAIQVDQFSVSFEFRITGGGGDGLAFVIQRTGASAVGGHGGGLGAVGLDGLAAELDVYPNPGCNDSAANQAAISTLAVCNSSDGMLLRQIVGSGAIAPALNNGAWRSASVAYDRGTMTIQVDGSPAITGHVVPGAPVGSPYWFGFSSGTGANPARQEVRNASITFPTPRCL